MKEAEACEALHADRMLKHSKDAEGLPLSVDFDVLFLKSLTYKLQSVVHDHTFPSNTFMHHTNSIWTDVTERAPKFRIDRMPSDLELWFGGTVVAGAVNSGIPLCNTFGMQFSICRGTTSLASDCPVFAWLASHA